MTTFNFDSEEIKQYINDRETIICSILSLLLSSHDKKEITEKLNSYKEKMKNDNGFFEDLVFEFIDKNEKGKEDVESKLIKKKDVYGEFYNIFIQTVSDEMPKNYKLTTNDNKFIHQVLKDSIDKIDEDDELYESDLRKQFISLATSLADMMKDVKSQIEEGNNKNTIKQSIQVYPYRKFLNEYIDDELKSLEKKLENILNKQSDVDQPVVNQPIKNQSVINQPDVNQPIKNQLEAKKINDIISNQVQAVLKKLQEKIIQKDMLNL